MAFTNSKREAKKAAKKHAKHARKQAEKQAKRAQSTWYKALNNAGPLFNEASKEARKRAEKFYGDYAPEVEKRVRKGLDVGQARVSGLSSRLSDEFDRNVGPRARKFRSDFEADYLPRARRTADAANTTLSAAVAAAVDAARAEWEKGAPEIRTAATTSPAADKKKSKVGTVLVVLGIAAVAGTAGYLAWQKTRPVEDPWAPPADFARSHYPAAGVSEEDSTVVSDSVAAAEAGDVSESLADGEKENTHKGE